LRREGEEGKKGESEVEGREYRKWMEEGKKRRRKRKKKRKKEGAG